MKLKFIIFLLLIFMPFFIFGNEKTEITNFHFVKTGPLETRIYLVDQEKNEGYGYYSFLKQSSHRGYNPFYNSTVIYNLYTIQDETEEPYKDVVEKKDIMNMAMSFEKFRGTMFFVIPSGIFGFCSLAAGIALMSYIGYKYSLYKSTLDPENEHYSVDSDYFSFLSKNDYTWMNFAGIATLLFGGVGIITFIIFAAIAGYNFYMFKGMKRRNLDTLNKKSKNKFKSNTKISFVIEIK